MIHSSVQIGTNSKISPFVSIEKNSSIGDNCYIGPHTHIGYNVKIGNNVYIGPYCEIYDDCILEEDTRIESHCKLGVDGFGYAQDKTGLSHYTPQIGNLVIEKNSHIFEHTNIDRAALSETRIAENSVLGGHSHIAHNLQIHKNAKIGSGLVVAGSTLIGENCVFGNRVNCNGHIQLGANFKVMSMSLINNSSQENKLQGGHPLAEAQIYKEIKESLRLLPELFTKIQSLANEKT